jgi:chemotaxis protein MotB
MPKKHKHEEHENHERWLVSYADFITLLFAFFVVMYSVSSVNDGKVKTVAISISDAMMPVSNSTSPLRLQSESLRGPSRNRDITVDMKLFRRLVEAIQPLKNGDMNGPAPRIAVTQEERGVVVSIAETMAFAPGRADVLPEAYDTLGRIASVLREFSNQVRIEGHTDNVPIHTAQYSSNWELSITRAINIVRFLGEGGHLPQDRLAAGGYGEYHPAATNDTAEGRAKNRRVELVVVRSTTTGDESSQAFGGVISRTPCVVSVDLPGSCEEHGP